MRKVSHPPTVYPSRKFLVSRILPVPMETENPAVSLLIPSPATIPPTPSVRSLSRSNGIQASQSCALAVSSASSMAVASSTREQRLTRSQVRSSWESAWDCSSKPSMTRVTVIPSTTISPITSFPRSLILRKSTSTSWTFPIPSWGSMVLAVSEKSAWLALPRRSPQRSTTPPEYVYAHCRCGLKTCSQPSPSPNKRILSACRPVESAWVAQKSQYP